MNSLNSVTHFRTTDNECLGAREFKSTGLLAEILLFLFIFPLLVFIEIFSRSKFCLIERTFKRCSSVILSTNLLVNPGQYCSRFVLFFCNYCSRLFLVYVTPYISTIICPKPCLVTKSPRTALGTQLATCCLYLHLGSAHQDCHKEWVRNLWHYLLDQSCVSWNRDSKPLQVLFLVWSAKHWTRNESESIVVQSTYLTYLIVQENLR